MKAATPRAVDATAATGNTRLMSLRRAGVLSSSEVSAGTATVAEASLVVLPVFLARGDLFVDSIEGSPNAAHRAGDADVLFAHNLESLVYQL